MKLRFPASLRVIALSIVDWWDSWLDMVLVTIVWFLAQVTIVFGPPATFGVYYVAYHMQKGQSLGIRGVVEGARKYFWKAWLWGLVNLLVIVITSFALWFYFNVKSIWGVYAEVIVLMLVYVWLCTQFYGLPYFMELEQKDLYTALKNGLLTTLAAPFFTLIVMLVAVLVLVLSFGIMLPLFLGLPGVVPLMGFRATYDRLVAFGLRKREKTPKEIEVEQGGRIFVPKFEQSRPEDASTGGSSAASGDVSEGEGQVEQKE